MLDRNNYMKNNFLNQKLFIREYHNLFETIKLMLFFYKNYYWNKIFTRNEIIISIREK